MVFERESSSLIFAFSFLSIISCISIKMTYSLFPQLHRKASKEILFYLSSSNLLAACATLIGGPLNSSSACWFQGIVSNVFTLASVLWTVIVCFTIYSIVVLGKSVDHSHDWMEFHVFCWGVPVVATLLPLINTTYDYVGNSGRCWLAPTEKTPLWGLIFWKWFSFYGIIWCAIVVMAFFLVLVTINLRHVRPESKVPVLHALEKLRWYPLVIIISLVFTTIYDTSSSTEDNSTWHRAANVIPCLQGFFTGLVFWISNDDVRLHLWQLITTGKVPEAMVDHERHNNHSEHSAKMFVEMSVTIGAQSLALMWTARQQGAEALAAFEHATMRLAHHHMPSSARRGDDDDSAAHGGGGLSSQPGSARGGVGGTSMRSGGSSGNGTAAADSIALELLDTEPLEVIPQLLLQKPTPGPPASLSARGRVYSADKGPQLPLHYSQLQQQLNNMTNKNQQQQSVSGTEDSETVIVEEERVVYMTCVDDYDDVEAHACEDIDDDNFKFSSSPATSSPKDVVKLNSRQQHYLASSNKPNGPVQSPIKSKQQHHNHHNQVVITSSTTTTTTLKYSRSCGDVEDQLYSPDTDTDTEQSCTVELMQDHSDHAAHSKSSSALLYSSHTYHHHGHCPPVCDNRDIIHTLEPVPSCSALETGDL